MSIECSDCGNKIHDRQCRFYKSILDKPEELLYLDETTKTSGDIKEQKSVLIEAHEIVSKRNDSYGEPTDTSERVAAAFSVLTKRKIKPADVALIQILFKIVRSEHGYKRDNSVDLAGYTDIRERCLLKEKEKEVE